MILSSHLNIYLKTTETCNLNCKHCFTSGSSGVKIFFNPDKIIRFFQALREECPWVKNVRFMFHGGEPLLAPIPDLYRVHEGLKNIFPRTTFGAQTNLTYPLTDAKRQFFKDVLLMDGFGTSWDYDIRFGSTGDRQKQIDLWEENVRTLVADGHYMTMIVSITKKLIEEKEPIEIINYAHSLGFKHILFERITSDGNAKINSDIIPSNREQNSWLHRMFKQSLEHKTYDYIGNMLLSELADAFVHHKHTANRCRVCEQSLLTINATGTIGGCPNTGPVAHWGHIDWPIMESLKSHKRLEAIACESFERNSHCYECPAFEYCNSDCNKLAWDEDNQHCPAPKSIWQQMINEQDIEAYKKLIIGQAERGPHGI